MMETEEYHHMPRYSENFIPHRGAVQQESEKAPKESNNGPSPAPQLSLQNESGRLCWTTAAITPRGLCDSHWPGDYYHTAIRA